MRGLRRKARETRGAYGAGPLIRPRLQRVHLPPQGGKGANHPRWVKATGDPWLSIPAPTSSSKSSTQPTRRARASRPSGSARSPARMRRPEISPPTWKRPLHPRLRLRLAAEGLADARSRLAAMAEGPDKASRAKVEFEATLINSFIGELLPKDAGSVFGEGSAGDMWRSMLSEQVSQQIAKSGALGLSRRLFATHDLVPARHGEATTAAAEAAQMSANILSAPSAATLLTAAFCSRAASADERFPAPTLGRAKRRGRARHGAADRRAPAPDGGVRDRGHRARPAGPVRGV